MRESRLRKRDTAMEERAKKILEADIEFENVNDATYDNGFILDNEDGAELDEDDDSDFYKEMGLDFDEDSMDDEENY